MSIGGARIDVTVGTKMSRYFLFGKNATLGNKMESSSEVERINVSPQFNNLKYNTLFHLYYVHILSGEHLTNDVYSDIIMDRPAR